MRKSVALCTFNGEKYIEQQLESILQQSTKIDEIVVFDDLSTDKTFEILQKFQIQFPQIFKVVQNEANLGYVQNFEKAITLCTGDLIFLSDQDDIWFPNKIKNVEKYFSENQNITVLCHNLNLSESENSEKNYWKLRNFTPNKTNQQILEQVVLEGNIFPGMSMVITKNAQQNYFPLKKMNHLIIHDFELIIKACKENSFGILNEILSEYRLHDDQNIGFDLRIPAKKITSKDIYTRSKSIPYIQKITEEFDLNKNLVHQYKADYNEYFKTFLKQFPLWKRPFVKIKIKHYLKIK